MKVKPICILNVHAPQDAENGRFPDASGIYIAFTSIRFRGTYTDFVLPIRPIYIGMSEKTDDNQGIRGRIADHLRNDHSMWQRHLPKGIEIQYGYIENPICPSLETVEAAMINVNKPQFNTEYKEQTPYPLNEILRFVGSIGALKPEICQEDLTLSD